MFVTLASLIGGSIPLGMARAVYDNIRVNAKMVVSLFTYPQRIAIQPKLYTRILMAKILLAKISLRYIERSETSSKRVANPF